MDMILPGHSLTDETVEEIWAFVDSSGSVGHDEMTQFLTQLYRIAREFKCIFNICYWDTAVTEVYKKILREDEILKCIPHHSGGTDINCVYQWIRDNKVKPDVMLILTDGYFGQLTTPTFSRQLGKKTILVLSSDIMINDDMKKIGKIAKL
jgi:predicted metal-dependent peptidase